MAGGRLLPRLLLLLLLLLPMGAALVQADRCTTDGVPVTLPSSSPYEFLPPPVGAGCEVQNVMLRGRVDCRNSHRLETQLPYENLNLQRVEPVHTDASKLRSNDQTVNMPCDPIALGENPDMNHCHSTSRCLPFCPRRR
jgi:hypothetical protein